MTDSTTPPAPLDLDDAEADILHSMASDDRQTRAEYQAGCKALASLIAELRRLRAAGEWVACSERMPDEEEPVLVCDDGVFLQAAWYEAYEPDDGTIEWRTDAGHLLLLVTHWRPLPSPPVEGT